MRIAAVVLFGALLMAACNTPQQTATQESDARLVDGSAARACCQDRQGEQAQESRVRR